MPLNSGALESGSSLKSMRGRNARWCPPQIGGRVL